MIEIKALDQNNKKHLHEFIQVQWDVLEKYPHWVPQIRRTLLELLNPRHPFYQTSEVQMFVGLIDKKPLGRIMAIDNKTSQNFHGDQIGQFGFFDCIENEKLAKELFKAARDFLKKRGLQKMQGPFNPSTNYDCGLLIEGFDDPPQIMMPYNPPYYQTLFEQQGLTKVKDLLAWQFIGFDFPMPEVMKKVIERTQRNHKITYRYFNQSKFHEEVALMHEIYNDAWEKNWGFIPMADAEFKHTAKNLKQVLDPNLIVFAFVDGQPAAFSVALPDYNQVFKHIPSGNLFPFGLFTFLTGKKHIDRFRVITLGIKQKFRHLALAANLYKLTKDSAHKLKYIQAETSWILEDNKNINRPIEMMGGKVYKTYRIFEQTL